METATFRKVSLARLASPAQFDALRRVTAPREWLALAALTLLCGAAVDWAFRGNLVTTVEASGFITGVHEATLRTAPDSANFLRPGMEVRFSPAGLTREDSAPASGRVTRLAPAADGAVNVEVALTSSSASLPEGSRTQARIVVRHDRPIDLLAAR